MTNKKSLTTPERLREMAEDESDYIRQMVAGDLETPADVLIKLSLDSSSQVMLVILTNENAPDQALKNMLTAKYEYVRERTANFILGKYADAKMNLTDQELCEVVQIAHLYKRSSNFDIIKLIEELQNEREHKLWLFHGSSSKQKPKK